MEWTLYLKDIEWQIGFKKTKSLWYAVYQRFTLGQMTHIDWKWGDGKRYFMPVHETVEQDLQ